MPDRTMYDSTDVLSIPKDATMVAGYVNGAYNNWDRLVAEFPDARKVSISVDPRFTADVLDVESGAATPSDVPEWVKAMRKLRRRPIVYTTFDNWSAVVAACRAVKIKPPFLWVADWTGRPHGPIGTVACQWTSPTAPINPAPGHYDISSVGPDWPDEYQKGHTTVNLKLPTWSTFYRALALVASALAYVIAIGNQLHLPPAIRTALIGAASGIAWIEHHKVTAGTPQKPPVTPGG
jgi:hypothetical protein